ncbi:enteropeptidase-like isoform X2 [Paramacrobiotus metropolitanus]|uniref:enteropeptidase-like isoform X2 n=1 Tax=Paramacrobiotus metropolitanus TaxID=2943436 RepID=UPI0024464DBA|nr:enteropeptidase-like isoform X2 [Paramacrobiotus metropolitanus]
MFFPVLFVFFCSASAYHWTLPNSQELFRTLLTNITQCTYTTEEFTRDPFFNGQQPTFGTTGKVTNTYYGICAPTVEACVHLGTTPHPVTDEFRGPGCEVCCARRTCGSYPINGNVQYGFCMLPELMPFNDTDGAFMTTPATTFTNTFGTFSTGQFTDPGFDTEDQMCLGFGGQIAQVTSSNWSIWWDSQCPMSGRCCLFPQPSRCETCGQKYGRMFNFNGTATGRSGGDDETLAWKTAVHQMAGTGWNLGMQPAFSPYGDQYSQTPPNYETLLSPQMWNNGLNFLYKNKETKKGDDDDDDDEDDYRGWCWQAAIMNKMGTGNVRCGGALIGERYVLTTAACANFTTGTFADYKIRFGATDIRKAQETNAVDYDIANVYMHPDYDTDTLDNNIAIMELQTPVTCNGKYICTICLPSPFIMYFSNFSMGDNHEQWIRDDVRQCVATGWGRRTSTGPQAYIKEMPYIPIYNNDTMCETNIRNMKGVPTTYTLPNNSFCAAPQPTTRGKMFSTCQGDAGGPLACWYGGRFYLTGLLSSFNTQRCDTGKTGTMVSKMLQPNRGMDTQSLVLDVFTDIAQFIPWINRIMYGFF